MYQFMNISCIYFTFQPVKPFRTSSSLPICNLSTSDFKLHKSVSLAKSDVSKPVTFFKLHN